MDALPLLVVALLSLSLVLLASSSNPNPRPNLSRAYHRAPRRFAADLIRDLNLFPGGIDGSADEIEGGGGGLSSSPRIMEKKLNLEILGDIGSDVSVEELGHHAGYYRLEHTHAAK